MSTDKGELRRINFHKSQKVPSELKTGFFIVLFCMIGLVISLVLFSSLTGAPDLSDMAQLIGP
jgi:hypothetical protein